MTSREEIKNNVERWVSENISDSFEFRPKQEEAVIGIIDSIVNRGIQNYALEAPTGLGKSLIAIISAGVLYEYYDLTSYILVSDLYLWKQYDDFLKDHKIKYYGSIKGQTGNYRCLKNKEDIRNGECRMSGCSWSSLFSRSASKSLGFECASKCEYVKARKKAVKSKVCVMTYQLFLFIMNNDSFNTDSHGNTIFSKKDVIFCDEAHNIPDIVRSKFSITVNEAFFKKLGQITDYYDLYIDKKNDHKSNDRLYESILKSLLRKDSTKDQDFGCLKAIYSIIISVNKNAESIFDDIKEKINESKSLKPRETSIFKTCTWLTCMLCHIEDLYKAVSCSGKEYLVKDISESNVTFTCTKEDFMIRKYLLDNASDHVFLSATIGNNDAFKENIGINYNGNPEKIKFEKLPSYFDFSKSPVYFLDKYKMSYKSKEESLKCIEKIAYRLLDGKLKNLKGIIQTGSYEIAENFYKNAPKSIQRRLMMYNGSKEKEEYISIHKRSNDSVMIGPSLSEGIDLPGNECSFIIILKVPYPSLKDKYVKEKIRLFPLWYEAFTSDKIIQGIGRGVRYNGDRCLTFIFDACFSALYKHTESQYPEELKKRIKLI